MDSPNAAQRASLASISTRHDVSSCATILAHGPMRDDTCDSGADMVAPIGMFTVADVPVEHAGSASGLFNTTCQLANAIGVAVLGTVFFEIAEGSTSRLPAEIFAPAFQATLGLVAVLMVVACFAARALPEAAPEGPVELH